MGECRIDHSLEDVKKKLEEQSAYLPADLFQQLSSLLSPKWSQVQLNELFHLLKKYDLAPEAERREREQAMESMLEGFAS